jgi:hypothetical protein
VAGGYTRLRFYRRIQTGPRRRVDGGYGTGTAVAAAVIGTRRVEWLQTAFVSGKGNQVTRRSADCPAGSGIFGTAFRVWRSDC